MAGRQRAALRISLCGLAVLLCALALRAWTTPPSPPAASLQAKGESMPSADVAAPEDPSARYRLSEHEWVRHVPDVTPAERRWLLERFELHEVGPVVAVTLSWDSGPHLSSVEAGGSPSPRTLYRVLTSSLELPPFAFEGLEAARRIGLPGDWVVRRGGEASDYLPYVAECVRGAGHSGFAFVREERTAPVYIARGVARSPDHAVSLFAPLEGLPPVPPESGTVREFLAAVSNAVGHRIRNDVTSARHMHVQWQDNSSAYRYGGPAVTTEMVSGLLGEIETALGVTLEATQESGFVWRLCADTHPR